jgi:hypothetical protein
LTYKVTERGPGVIFIHGGPIPGNLLTTSKDWGVFRNGWTVTALSLGSLGRRSAAEFFSQHDTGIRPVHRGLLRCVALPLARLLFRHRDQRKCRPAAEHPDCAADYFIQQALKKNAPVDVLNHATGQHGFDSRDDNERTRDILRRTIDFIKSSFA